MDNDEEESKANILEIKNLSTTCTNSNIKKE